jgi:hypothetical protein
VIVVLAARGARRFAAGRRNDLTEDHLKVHRSWSSYQSLDQGERYQVKRIVVKGGRLSPQINQHRIRGGDDDQILDPEQATSCFSVATSHARHSRSLLAPTVPKPLSMRRTGRHTRIDRPVAKASVHGMYFTVRLSISPGQGGAGRALAESYRSAIGTQRARGFTTLARKGGPARRERPGFVLRELGGVRWEIGAQFCTPDLGCPSLWISLGGGSPREISAVLRWPGRARRRKVF